MKYPSIIITAVAAISALASCKCSSDDEEFEKAQQLKQLKQQQEIIDTLTADTKRLIASGSCLNPAPFIQKDAKGEIFLTEKEKMLKPDYLTKPSRYLEMVTLSQKYRLLAVLGVDRLIADLYEEPITDYDAAIYTLAADIDDGALSKFVDKRHYCTDDLSSLLKGEYATGRGPFAWEFLAASVVEQMWALSNNIEKLMPMFDDTNAASFSANLGIVHDAFEDLCASNTDLIPLRDAMAPLYIINATSTEELKDQLIEMKGAIKAARSEMLK